MRKKRPIFFCLIKSGEFSAAICFLTNVFHLLNQLNMKLQGRYWVVTQLVERLNAFQRKLTFVSADLCPGKRLHSPTLHIWGLKITEVMTGFKLWKPACLKIQVYPLKCGDLWRNIFVWMLKFALKTLYAYCWNNVHTLLQCSRSLGDKCWL